MILQQYLKYYADKAQGLKPPEAKGQESMHATSRILEPDQFRPAWAIQLTSIVCMPIDIKIAIDLFEFCWYHLCYVWDI